ncbi:MAG: IS21 family transposase [Steroidobacteraceae bacterium]
MSEYEKTGKIVPSALQADMDVQTARKYIRAGKGPDQLKAPHTWLTRQDPLAAIWNEVEQMLQAAPEVEAKALFEHFLERPDSGLQEKHLRTFQRRVSHWRSTRGPEQEVYFAQDRSPGKLMQLDWTYARTLQVTIQGEPLDHLFCHCVLPYSNWQWATRCISESFLSLVSGLQAAFRELQRIPQTLCTDNTSAATHEVESMPERPRAYNSDYLELCTHYDLSPLTIHVGCPHEQGDVESQNRHLKRRLEQRLILRGSRDFQSLEAYDAFVQEVVRKANASRQEKVAEELACMRPLPAGELADYREYEAVVSSQSLIRVKKIAYSVPSRLIGRRLRIRLHEAHLKVYLGAEHLFDLPRLRGDRGALVDFRHVVEPLLRKPGAFANYRHRQALYPGVEFRAAHDRLEADHGQRSGVIEYLQLLKLAADQGVEAVRELLPCFLERKGKWRVTQLRELLAPPERKIVELQAPEPSLADYDLLLEQEVAHVV